MRNDTGQSAAPTAGLGDATEPTYAAGHAMAGPRHCRGCDYDLRASIGKCPECGRAFDAGNPKSVRKRPRRKWLRWTVMTGCALLVVFCVLTGLWRREMGKWEAEQRAIEKLRGLNFQLKQQNVAPAWLQNLLGTKLDYVFWRIVEAEGNSYLGQDYFPQPTEEKGDGSRARMVFEQIASLSHLKRLRLRGVDFEFCKLKDVPLPASLENLELYDCILKNRPDFHMEQLSSLRLASICFSHGDDSILEQLGKCPNLEIADLIQDGIDGSGLGSLRGLTKLRSIDLAENPVGDKFVAQLAALPALRNVDLMGTNVSDAGLRPLFAASRIEWLRVGGESYDSWQASMKEMGNSNFTFSAPRRKRKDLLTTDAFSGLLACRSLRTLVLDVETEDVTRLSALADHLAQAPALQTLIVAAGEEIGPWNALARSKSLRRLTFSLGTFPLESSDWRGGRHHSDQPALEAAAKAAFANVMVDVPDNVDESRITMPR